MEENVTNFLNLFIDLEKTIERVTGMEQHVPFTVKLNEAVKKNAVVKQNKWSIKFFNDIRNFLVHEKQPNVIPHKDTVNNLSNVIKKINNPPLVYPSYCTTLQDLKIVNKCDYLITNIRDIYTASYSQYPIIENNRVCELLNTNTITRWLASQEYDGDAILINNPSIEELLDFIEHKENYAFVNRHSNIYDVLDVFNDSITDHQIDLDAVFITQSGSPTETILGMCTLYDVMIGLTHVDNV